MIENIKQEVIDAAAWVVANKFVGGAIFLIGFTLGAVIL